MFIPFNYIRLIDNILAEAKISKNTSWSKVFEHFLTMLELLMFINEQELKSNAKDWFVLLELPTSVLDNLAKGQVTSMSLKNVKR